jgi:Lipase (class 3)
MPAPVPPPLNYAQRLANGVCAAYAAYNNGSNLAPTLPGYNSFNVIQVYELDPNVFPWSLTAEGEKAAAAAAKAGVAMAGQPAAYASPAGAPPPPCTGPIPVGTPSMGYQLFGFTATANDNSHNIFVLRGTVTMEEAYYDVSGWGTKTACMLPTQGSPHSYGMVNSSLWYFYTQDDLGFKTSLAASCMNAIQATNAQAPNLPWFMGSHSLGGAMLSLAAFDAMASGALTSPPFVMTFGSLHVGDATFAGNYMTNLPTSYRIANLCDFVPSMVSLEPVIYPDPYVHVGIEGTFVWQTWDDWGNHSLANIYMPMVQSTTNWSLIKWGPRHYPQ